LGEKIWTLAPIGVCVKIQMASLSLPMFTQPWLEVEYPTAWKPGE